jgi:hypothetical protein
MVGVVQHKAKAELLQVYRIDSLYRPQRADRHEGRGVDLAMDSAESPQSRARLTIFLLN